MKVRATLVTLVALGVSSPALAGDKNPFQDGGGRRRVPVSRHDGPRAASRPAAPPRVAPSPRPSPSPRATPMPRAVPETRRSPDVRIGADPAPSRPAYLRSEPPRAPVPFQRSESATRPAGAGDLLGRQPVPRGGQVETPRARIPVGSGRWVRTEPAPRDAVGLGRRDADRARDDDAVGGRRGLPFATAPSPAPRGRADVPAGGGAGARRDDAPAPGFRVPPGHDGGGRRDGAGRDDGGARRDGGAARDGRDGAGLQVGERPVRLGEPSAPPRAGDGAGRPGGIARAGAASPDDGRTGLLRDAMDRRDARRSDGGPGKDGFFRGAASTRDGAAGRGDAHDHGDRGRGGDGRERHGWSRSHDDYRDAWRDGFRRGYRVGYDDGRRDRYHDWYDRHGVFLSFHFGVGAYLGVRYFSPFRHWYTGCDYAFFYPAPVTYCYVPWGFYVDTSPVYVTRYVHVRRTVPTVVYETRETVSYDEVVEVADAAPSGAAAPPSGETVEPAPAASSPATEKFLRDGSERFRAADYYEAAVQFRLAALSAPTNPAPLFALSQALMAMGQDAYAARVLRKAFELAPGLLEEPADIVGVFRDQAEFERVAQALEARAAAAPADGDARLLLGALRYFSGDPRARTDFARLGDVLPEDQAVLLFRSAVEKRFLAADELPEIK